MGTEACDDGLVSGRDKLMTKLLDSSKEENWNEPLSGTGHASRASDVRLNAMPIRAATDCNPKTPLNQQRCQIQCNSLSSLFQGNAIHRIPPFLAAALAIRL